MFSSDDLSSLRLNATSGLVEIIDQTLLPHRLQWCALDSLAAYCHAIEVMQVRGAPLIGITAAFGLAHAITEDSNAANMERAAAQLLATRPTAVNLRWALDQVMAAVAGVDKAHRAAAAWARAQGLREEDVANCSRIGDCGLEQLQQLASTTKGDRLNIMTHCNAGWLATIQWGTALATRLGRFTALSRSPWLKSPATMPTRSRSGIDRLKYLAGTSHPCFVSSATVTGSISRS